ncbi:MAG: hypothetical protein EXS35_06595 [Pedosphaera sp.]|nr:hypothetical protein [Pedosphaera sp.]
MTDYFALFNEPRRPWLDVEALKQKFFSRSATVHPDRVHQANEAERNAADQRYKELNAAFNCLREPRDRLRHLLELESGAKPADLQEVPAHLAEVCMAVGRLCREADVFHAEQQKITSALLRAQRFPEGQELTDRLMDLQKAIAGQQELVLTQIKSLDDRWNQSSRDATARSDLLRDLEAAYRLLGFFLRWQGQLQERVVRLAF